MLHPDRLFPAEQRTRDIARALYESVHDLPIISPHGHTDPSWFSLNLPFEDPVSLFILPDHYLFRMLYSQGIRLGDIGITPKRSNRVDRPREIWRLFAENYHLFRGTPSRIWLDHVFSEVFDLQETLTFETADRYFEHISEALQQPDYMPRALFERFNIELLATTESPLDTLPHHDLLMSDPWPGRIITTFRPDSVLDPEFEGFAENLDALSYLFLQRET